AHIGAHITRSDQGHDLLSGDTNSMRIRVMNNPAPWHERGDPEFPANSTLFPLQSDVSAPNETDRGGNPRRAGCGRASFNLISAPLSRESEGPQQSIDQLHNNKALELFVSCTTLSRRAVLRAVPRAPTIENPV